MVDEEAVLIIPCRCSTYSTKPVKGKYVIHVCLPSILASSSGEISSILKGFLSDFLAKCCFKASRMVHIKAIGIDIATLCFYRCTVGATVETYICMYIRR